VSNEGNPQSSWPLVPQFELKKEALNILYIIQNNNIGNGITRSAIKNKFTNSTDKELE